ECLRDFVSDRNASARQCEYGNVVPRAQVAQSRSKKSARFVSILEKHGETNQMRSLSWPRCSPHRRGFPRRTALRLYNRIAIYKPISLHDLTCRDSQLVTEHRPCVHARVKLTILPARVDAARQVA